MCKLSDVDCKHGAPMGRVERRDGDTTLSATFIPTNSGGYDEGGAYWGTGEPLWMLESQDGGTTLYRRSKTFANLIRHMASEGFAVTLARGSLSDIEQGFIAAALFSANPQPYSGAYVPEWEVWEEMDQSHRSAMRDQVARFTCKGRLIATLLEHIDANEIGRTLYLATSGHGISFSDRKLPSNLSRLTDEFARTLPQMTLYAWPDVDCEDHRETGECGCDCDHGYTYSFDHS
jgi:hypothetical protein